MPWIEYLTDDAAVAPDMLLNLANMVSIHRAPNGESIAITTAGAQVQLPIQFDKIRGDIFADELLEGTPR